MTTVPPRGPRAVAARCREPVGAVGEKLVLQPTLLPACVWYADDTDTLRQLPPRVKVLLRLVTRVWMHCARDPLQLKDMPGAVDLASEPDAEWVHFGAWVQSALEPAFKAQLSFEIIKRQRAARVCSWDCRSRTASVSFTEHGLCFRTDAAPRKEYTILSAYPLRTLPGVTR